MKTCKRIRKKMNKIIRDISIDLSFFIKNRKTHKPQKCIICAGSDLHPSLSFIYSSGVA